MGRGTEMPWCIIGGVMWCYGWLLSTANGIWTHEKGKYSGFNFYKYSRILDEHQCLRRPWKFGSFLEIDWKIKLGSLKQTPRFVYNFRTADWDGLREDLVKILWDTIYLMCSVDNVWEAWKTLFFQAVERNIQKKLTKRRRDVPWLNSDSKKLLHKKRGRLWRKAKFSGDQANGPTIKNLATWWKTI